MIARMTDVIAALRESRCRECGEPWSYDEGRCDHQVACSFAAENVPGRVFGRSLRTRESEDDDEPPHNETDRRRRPREDDGASEVGAE